MKIKKVILDREFYEFITLGGATIFASASAIGFGILCSALAFTDAIGNASAIGWGVGLLSFSFFAWFWWSILSTFFESSRD